MGPLANRLSMLRNAFYLQAKIEKDKLLDVELLSNGKRLREQIERQWLLTQSNSDTSMYNAGDTMSESTDVKEVDSRLRFLFTQQFRQNVQLMKKGSQATGAAMIISKLESHEFDTIASPLHFKFTEGAGVAQLISEYFFHASCGLAKLYNIQRERKIWWMRCSADPSRYYLEPYDLSNHSITDKTTIANAQSITIKSRLPFFDLAVEHITLVPLNEVLIENKQDFEIYNERNGKLQLPAIIRSVINLDMATAALIFDAAANNKREETMFLNRRLTPYQCCVSCEDDSCVDLQDLSTHLSYVIHRAGLRLLDFNESAHDSQKFESKLATADELGVPYTILVERDSLSTGLLKLRSRDTTLEETIHISDIPGYLLNIFNAS